MKPFSHRQLTREKEIFNYHLISGKEFSGMFFERCIYGIIKNYLKMPGSRGRIGPGGVKGQCPCGGLPWRN